MGEGWSDWFAVSFFADESDDPAGPATVGEYVTGNYTRGIRRYPYAHDMAINPLTYADLCNQGCQVHRDGEIWASALWDVRHDLIAVHGFAEGRHRAELLVVDGLKLSACSPSFVTMRDSILQAEEQRYAGEDACTLRTAFARRGLGAMAESEGNGGTATADFSLVAPLDHSLHFAADGETLFWQGRAEAVGYPVARGGFVADAAANTFDDAECQGEAAGDSFVDSEVPGGGGQGFYYLVAVTDDCGSSGWGSDSRGGLRTVAVPCP